MRTTKPWAIIFTSYSTGKVMAAAFVKRVLTDTHGYWARIQATGS
jgi:hypothetical protein